MMKFPRYGKIKNVPHHQPDISDPISSGNRPHNYNELEKSPLSIGNSTVSEPFSLANC
jgi:hypothetical protein